MNPLEVAQEIATSRNLLPQDILGKQRYSELVAARKEVASKLFSLGMSRSAIGRFLNHKDHTTISRWLKSYQPPFGR